MLKYPQSCTVENTTSANESNPINFAAFSKTHFMRNRPSGMPRCVKCESVSTQDDTAQASNAKIATIRPLFTGPPGNPRRKPGFQFPDEDTIETPRTRLNHQLLDISA
jgi:hypothetical protein